MVRRAIERILAKRTPEKFNSLEIVRVDSLASKRFFGIRHVTVAAQSRHIQESPFLFRATVKRSEPPALVIGSESPLGEIEAPALESVRI